MRGRRSGPEKRLGERVLRVALLTPSSPVLEDALEAGLQVVRQEGPRIGFLAGSPSGGTPLLPYLAGDDREQAARFSARMLDPDIDFVWAVRGGYGSLRWVDQVDWNKVRPGCPPVIGFSDITFLHAALARAGCISIHGPLVATLSSTSQEARKSLWESLRAGRFPELQGIPLCPGTARGKLAGGNLTCLIHTLGTAYEPPWDGAVLLLEDHNESLYRIDRMLTHLRLSGRLDRVAGIAVGQLLGTGASEEAVRTLIEDRLCGFGKPVVAGLPAGHGLENQPLLLGGSYGLNADQGLLTPEPGTSFLRA